MKIGDFVSCWVKSNPKSISLIKTEIQNKFEIISLRPIYYESEYNLYMILLPDDFLGWQINKFHIQHQGVDEKFLGKKFYEIADGSLVFEEEIK